LHQRTWEMSRKSWLTRTRPPSQLLIARANESMVSMSYMPKSTELSEVGAVHRRLADCIAVLGGPGT